MSGRTPLVISARRNPVGYRSTSSFHPKIKIEPENVRSAPVRAAEAGVGYIKFKIHPYADVFLDGTLLGDMPSSRQRSGGG